MTRTTYRQRLGLVIVLVGMMAIGGAMLPSPAIAKRVEALTRHSRGAVARRPARSSERAMPARAANQFPPCEYFMPTADESTFCVSLCANGNCTFGPNTPLEGAFDIHRVTGDPSLLETNHLASAVVTFPIYDHDPDEVDEEVADLYINGHHVSWNRYGANERWTLIRANVPLDWLNFAADNGVGSSPSPGHNEVSFYLDEDDPVAWLCVEVYAPSPVLLVHGVWGTPAIWDTIWIPRLNARGVPSEAIAVDPEGSIAANSAAIDTKVQNAKRRWGVGRVTLVGHSKGGVDAFDYSYGHLDVDKLLLMDSPVLGLPEMNTVETFNAMAAKAWARAHLPGHPRPFCGAGGRDLTPKAMSVYMGGHQHPQGHAEYASVTGDYDPLCQPCADRQRALAQASISMYFPNQASDGVVSVASALGLPFGLHYAPYHTSGADDYAYHTRVHDSEELYDRTHHSVLAERAPLVRAHKVESSDSSGVPTHRSVLLANGRAAVQDTFMVDGSSIDVIVLSNATAPTLMVRAPDGRTFWSDSASSYQDVMFGSGSLWGSAGASFSAIATEAGVWVVTITPSEETDSTSVTAYAVDVSSGGVSTLLTLGATPEVAPAGDSTVVAATLIDGESRVLGAHVECEVFGPDSNMVTVGLHDDGAVPDTLANDGAYTGRVVLRDGPGTYRVIVRANGSSGGLIFERTGEIVVTAKSSGVVPSGDFDDRGLDFDDNGLFDRLCVDVGLSVALAGRYRIYGSLRDSSGWMIDAVKDTVLDAGTASIPLLYDGAALFDRGVNGPYLLEGVHCEEIRQSESVPAGSYSGTYETYAYAYQAFQSPRRIRLNGAMSMTSIVGSSGCYYDSLRFEQPVVVPEAGPYVWEGFLVDSLGVSVLASGSMTLRSGPNVLAFTFTSTQVLWLASFAGGLTLKNIRISGMGFEERFGELFSVPAIDLGGFGGSIVAQGPYSVTLCPGGDADSVWFDIGYGGTCSSGMHRPYAVLDYSNAVIWDAVKQPWECVHNAGQPIGQLEWTECTSDTLWPAWVDTAARVAHFVARKASLSGFVDYEIYDGGHRIVPGYVEFEVRGLDMGGQLVGAAEVGCVDPYDIRQWAALAETYPGCTQPFPEYSDPCPGDFDFDDELGAADTTMLRAHLGHSVNGGCWNPSGGGAYNYGDSIDVRWGRVYAESAYVSIQLLRDGYVGQTSALASDVPDSGRWVPPWSASPLIGDAGGGYRMRVEHTYGHRRADGSNVAWSAVSGGFAIGAAPDTMRPSVVSDLEVGTLGRHSATVMWTDVGDDSLTGTASLVRIVYSTQMISESNFGSCNSFATVVPGSAGTVECADTTGLAECQTYYLALKTQDDAGNWSGLSNVVSGQTRCSGFLEALCDGDNLMAQGGTEGGWELESSLLNGAGFERPTEDVYRLRRSLLTTNSEARIRLSQRGSSAITLDVLSLAAVDHDADEQAFVSDRELLFGTLGPVERVVDASGTDLTTSLSSGDEVVSASKGSQWEVHFGDKVTGPTALLLEVRGIDGINVETLCGHRQWTSLGTVIPRRTFAPMVVDSIKDGRVRISFTGPCQVRSVGEVAVHGPGKASTLELTLSGAEHSRLGSVMVALGASAGTDVVLRPRESVVASFSVPALPVGKVRDYFLSVRGKRTSAAPSPNGLETEPEAEARPLAFALHQSEPNPFAHTTRIRFDLPKPSSVKLEIFDLQGRRIARLADGFYPAGYHTSEWDGSTSGGNRVQAGVYIYRLQAGSFRAQKKMVLVP